MQGTQVWVIPVGRLDRSQVGNPAHGRDLLAITTFMSHERAASAGNASTDMWHHWQEVQNKLATV